MLVLFEGVVHWRVYLFLGLATFCVARKVWLPTPDCLACLDLHYVKLLKGELVNEERYNWPVPETLLGQNDRALSSELSYNIAHSSSSSAAAAARSYRCGSSRHRQDRGLPGTLRFAAVSCLLCCFCR